MQNLEKELQDHFIEKVLICASKLQSEKCAQRIDEPMLHANTCEVFADELLKCLDGLSEAKVKTKVCKVIIKLCFLIDCYIF